LKIFPNIEFFDLLLRIDRRINSQEYKLKKEEDALRLVKKIKT